MLSVQEHSSQHVCTTQEKKVQHTIRMEWRGGRFGALRPVYEEALQGMF